MLAARGVGGRLTVPATVTDLDPASNHALETAYERWRGAIR
jgi:hypothetical protein